MLINSKVIKPVKKGIDRFLSKIKIVLSQNKAMANIETIPIMNNVYTMQH
jgi:hypothetical protein